MLDVNKDGAEAAAASSVAMSSSVFGTIYHKKIVFNADHPFMYAIRLN